MAITEVTKQLGETRTLLHGVSWDVYRLLCEELQQRATRLTYSDGVLEIMVTNPPHEYYKKLIAKLVEMVCFVKNIDVRSGGSMTFQRPDLEKGFEHDECWWIAHERLVRGMEKFNPQRDPPPDLAVEVEITSSAINRLSIFAALGVPEIWRFDGTSLRFYALQPTGEYTDVNTSVAFPFLRPPDLLPYLLLPSAESETVRMHRFADWLRSQQ